MESMHVQFARALTGFIIWQGSVHVCCAVPCSTVGSPFTMITACCLSKAQQHHAALQMLELPGTAPLQSTVAWPGSPPRPVTARRLSSLLTALEPTLAGHLPCLRSNANDTSVRPAVVRAAEATAGSPDDGALVRFAGVCAAKRKHSLWWKRKVHCVWCGEAHTRSTSVHAHAPPHP